MATFEVLHLSVNFPNTIPEKPVIMNKSFMMATLREFLKKSLSLVSQSWKKS